MATKMKRITFALTVVLLAIPMYGSVGITTTTLPNGVEKSAYSATVTASGGCYPYAWEIAAGSLPPGLTGSGTSNTDTYTITGTPTSSGTFNFTVWVEGCGLHTSSYAYSVIIQPASAVGQISSDFFGMHVNQLTNPWPTAAGIQFTNYRTHDSSDIMWSQLNPSAGTYYWQWLDVALQKSQQYGTYVDFDFYYTPSWASSNPSGSCTMGNNGGCFPPNDLNADGTGTDQHVKDFMGALMQHVGAGKFKYIEIWNEFNNSIEWSGTIAQLVRISQDVNTIAKSYDPNVKIIGPAETGDWTQAGDNEGMRWLGEFLSAGGGQYVDIINLHGHVTNPEDIIARTNSALAEMAQYGQSAKPLFDTEASWPIIQGLASDRQRGYLFREYLATLSTPTQAFYVYAYDIDNTANYWNTPSQQVTVNGNAYKLFYGWLVGSTMTSKCQPQTEGSSTWSCTFTMQDGTQAMAIWNTAVTYPTTISVTVPTIYSTYFTLDGQSHSVNSTHNVPIGYEPIWLEN
jgi:hypothetical protein